jgi:hypothetical protein
VERPRASRIVHGPARDSAASSILRARPALALSDQRRLRAEQHGAEQHRGGNRGEEGREDREACQFSMQLRYEPPLRKR